MVKKREPALPAANISKPNTNSTAEVYKQRLLTCSIPNTTKPFKLQATCENEFKSSSRLYCDASNLDRSKPLVSWPVLHDSSEPVSTVFTEHELKLQQSCKSLKGHTAQNGAMNVTEQVKPRLKHIQDNHQTQDCINNFPITTIPHQRFTGRIGQSLFYLQFFFLLKLPIFRNTYIMHFQALYAIFSRALLTFYGHFFLQIVPHWQFFIFTHSVTLLHGLFRRTFLRIFTGSTNFYR